MKPAPFELHRPTTLADALSILGEVADEGGLVLAGGQSLIPMMALRVAYPPHLVDINGVEGLDAAVVESGALRIGATVRHSAFHRPVEPGVLGRLMAAVSRNIAHYPIRMRGTFCGSLAHADPASEWCLTAVTLDATVHLANTEEQRSVPAQAFVDGAMSTAIEPGEIIVAASIPLLQAGTRFGFHEFSRRAGDYAIGMSLVTLTIEDGVIRAARIGLGAIEEKASRVEVAEQVLIGEPPSPALFARAAAVAAESTDPMEDAATSAEYRRDLAAVVVRRALEAAFPFDHTGA